LHVTAAVLHKAEQEPPSLSQSLAIEVSIHIRQNRLDLRTQLLLNAEQIGPVIVREEVHSQTEMPKAAGAPHTMEIRFRVLWKVKVITS
jgi:hypothetical protein